MFKKFRCISLIVICTLFLAVGCTNSNDTTEIDETKEVKQIFKYNMSSHPETLDPTLASEIVGFNVIVNAFEGLTSLDSNDKAVPGVAERWEVSDDEMVYTFYLKDDAKWSDGKPVTAYDFEYAWKRGIDSSSESDYAYQLFYIKNAEDIVEGNASIDELGVEVIDDKTLKVTLESPTSWMPEMFAFPTYFPVRKEIVEKNPDTWTQNEETLVSNGPFKVTKLNNDEKIVMEKNKFYWGKDRVKLEEIHFTLINDSSTALGAFEAGELDGVDNIPTVEIPRLRAESDEFLILPDLGLYYYIFNNSIEPFNDLKVRKALSLAIDRKAIVNAVSLGGEIPASGVVPEGLKIGGKDFRQLGNDYDIDVDNASIQEARLLLAQAGYPEGEGFPVIKLSYNTNELHQRIAEAIQEMWKVNLNVDCELVNVNWLIHLKKLSEGDYQVGRLGWSADYVHPMTFLDMWITESGNNYSKWNDKKFDEYIKKAKSTVNEKETLKYLHKAENLLMNRHTIMPIYYTTDPEMMKKYVKGWRKSMLGMLYLDKAYISDKK